MHNTPRYMSALLSALRFREPGPERVRALNQAEWEQLLAFSDRAHLTLIFGKACWGYLPSEVRERIAQNLVDQAFRLERLQENYSEIAEALARSSAEHLVLKGFSHWPDFAPDIHLRMQSDLDLYCPGGSLFRARDALLQIGYQFDASPENSTSDHLPPLVRNGPWKWRGNAFDPEMPPGVELHYRLWNVSHTRLGPVSFGQFWDRRVERRVGSICFAALHPVDAFGYSALHALSHLLSGGLLPSHIYEVGYFLHKNARNEALWKAWLDWHDSPVRVLAAIPSLLAAEWFACDLPLAVEEEICRLPETVHRWFKNFSNSPLGGLFEPNKDALWLQLSLISSPRDRCSVLARRLLPLKLPPLSSRWVQKVMGKTKSSPRESPIQTAVTYLNWFVQRSAYHLRMFPLTLWRGLKLWST